MQSSTGVARHELALPASARSRAASGGSGSSLAPAHAEIGGRRELGKMLDEARAQIGEALDQCRASLGRTQVRVALGDAERVDLIILMRHSDFGALEAGGAEARERQTQLRITLQMDSLAASSPAASAPETSAGRCWSADQRRVRRLARLFSANDAGQQAIADAPQIQARQHRAESRRYNVRATSAIGPTLPPWPLMTMRRVRPLACKAATISPMTSAQRRLADRDAAGHRAEPVRAAERQHRRHHCAACRCSVALQAASSAIFSASR